MLVTLLKHIARALSRDYEAEPENRDTSIFPARVAHRCEGQATENGDWSILPLSVVRPLRMPGGEAFQE